ncbi:PREDICTED: inactive tyrosine-protein kinase 7-like [Priapulus caudatus]|uniref:Inactive tyrosine-protein kinase 7-like n=1 Tax=Priapulus caudatus TaxID=37621 RepID=A0ABM1E6U3_PRICU|nr:PREDICTED: inactive tyrosine-protein kinase 7-like [Priapulus caudatus]
MEWLLSLARAQDFFFFTEKPANADVVEGSPVVLRCDVSRHAHIVVAWQLDGSAVANTTRRYQNDTHLWIRRAQRERDAGGFRCTATNVTSGTSKSTPAATLNIQYAGLGGSSHGWKPRTLIAQALRHQMSVFPNGSLYFERVKGGDAGIYKCVGLSADSAAGEQTYQAEIKIATIHDLTGGSFEPAVEDNRVTIVPLNNNFEMTCVNPGGYPYPSLRWDDPSGNAIGATSRVRVEEDGSRLVVDVVRQSDSGNYSCVVSNMAGVKRNNIKLVVSVEPKITRHPESMMVEESKTALFHCDYTGSPAPYTTITWTRNGSEIELRHAGRWRFLDDGGLEVSDVRLKDAGRYACEVATRGFPAVRSRAATLDVKGSVERTRSPTVTTTRQTLKFTPEPVNKRLELGGDGKLWCKASGVVPPKITWVKVSDGGRAQVTWPDHITDSNGTLIVKGVKASDAGQYTCVATSAQQGVINKTITVDVIVTPRFVVRPSNTTAKEGYEVMLHCAAEGDPKPTIQWDKNGHLSDFDKKRFELTNRKGLLSDLDTERFEVLQNGSLYVKELYLDDAGRYGCTIGNSGGFKRDEVTLYVRGKDEGVMTKTIIIAVGCAAGYIILVVGLLIYCKVRRAKQRKQAKADEAEVEDNRQENGTVPNAATELKTSGLGGGDALLSDGTGSSHSKNRASYDRLQFPRQDLNTIGMLGKGECDGSRDKPLASNDRHGVRRFVMGSPCWRRDRCVAQL